MLKPQPRGNGCSCNISLWLPREAGDTVWGRRFGRKQAPIEKQIISNLWPGSEGSSSCNLGWRQGSGQDYFSFLVEFSPRIVSPVADTSSHSPSCCHTKGVCLHRQPVVPEVSSAIWALRHTEVIHESGCCVPVLAICSAPILPNRQAPISPLSVRGRAPLGRHHRERPHSTPSSVPWYLLLKS